MPYKPTIEVVCHQCGEPFLVAKNRTDTAKFCGKSCAGIHRIAHGPKLSKPKTGPTLNCQVCGKGVHVPQYRAGSFRYCSRRCQALAARVQAETDCAVCGTRFTHISSRCKSAKYCSKACYYKAMSKVGTIELKCVVCGESFRRSPSKVKYANPCCGIRCRGLLMRTNNPRGGGSGARAWLKRRGLLDICNRCGYQEHPEILVAHHKDRHRSNNTPDNLEVLCPNCHAIEHYADTSSEVSA